MMMACVCDCSRCARACVVGWVHMASGVMCVGLKWRTPYTRQHARVEGASVSVFVLLASDHSSVLTHAQAHKRQRPRTIVAGAGDGWVGLVCDLAFCTPAAVARPACLCACVYSIMFVYLLACFRAFYTLAIQS